MVFIRYPAKKMRIKDILNSDISSEDNQTILIFNGEKIFRVNLIGTLIHKDETQNSEYSIIDDTTGKIEVRNFGDKKFFNNIIVGDIINVIGRINYFRENIFINPEIISRTESLWLKHRLLELSENDKEQNIKKDSGVDRKKSEIEDMIDFIRKKDSGDGVDIYEILNSNISNAENILEDIKSKGYIFEISPGKYKVLE